MVELIKGFVVNFVLLLNVNLIVGTTFSINGHDLNYNKSEAQLSLKVFYYFIQRRLVRLPGCLWTPY